MGRKAIKAKETVAMTAILSASLLSWKKVTKLMKAITQSGMKIESREDPGFL